jgi:hypothetical protein
MEQLDPTFSRSRPAILVARLVFLTTLIAGIVIVATRGAFISRASDKAAITMTAQGDNGRDKPPSTTYNLAIKTPTLNPACTANPVVVNNADSGAGSLRQAILDACLGSTITFDMTPGHVTSPITLTTAELSINENLTITGPGANALTISGNNSSRVFNIQSGIVIISDLTISSGTSLFLGGGISNAGTLTISNSTITGNSVGSGATNGGGVYNAGDGATATLTLNNSIVSGNTAGAGGGIFNFARNGGSATLTVSNSVISGNLTSGSVGGGGIESLAQPGGTASLKVNNSTVSGNSNSSGNCGGIFSGAAGGPATATITNSTISGNSSNAGGGGVCNSSAGGSVATMAFTNSTISGNSALTSGSGLRIVSAGTAPTTLNNTIVAGNFKLNSTTPDDISSTVDPSSSFNLIGTGGSGGLTNGVNNNQVGVSNALLGALANNGGPTQTMALLPGSPAIDAGNNSAVTNPPFSGPPFADQRGVGFNRFADGNGDGAATVDIGAYEVQSILVTNTNDSGPGSLRQAILDANARAGTDLITFSIGSGLQTIAPTALLPDITDPVVIDATSQPGFSGVPLIELSGANALSLPNVGLLTLKGGNTTIRGLIVNHCKDFGISIVNAGGNHIEGNFLGTDATGNLTTNSNGNLITINNSPNNVIGGTSPGTRNVISGSGSHGISIFGSSGTGNVIQGNYIGLNAAGTAGLGNFSGIFLGTSNNIVGGTTPEARNVISANDYAGIVMQVSGTSGNLIQGNYIGTNATGTANIGNTNYGVAIFNSSNNNTIGGVTADARNVISGNGWGVSIASSNGRPLNNVVQGNYIGVAADGTTPLGNRVEGVRLADAMNTTVGGSMVGAANVIAFNGPTADVGVGTGVEVLSGTNNSIRGNSIFSNGRLGIDLDNNGVTPNDNCDGDSGSNNLQNYPVLVSALSSGGSTNIQGTLNSAPNTSFQVDFYSSSACDPSAYGEGQTFLGSTTVMTDASCNAAINAVFPLAVDSGQVITATATDPGGNTSEFSACIQTVTPTPSVLRIDSVAAPAGRASGGQLIRLNGAFAGLSMVAIGGVPTSWFYTNGSGDTSTITVITPTHAVGAVQIDLTPTSGVGFSKANAFAYLPTVFTDDTLAVNVTTVKAQHIIELRQAVDAMRAVAGLGGAPWTDPGLAAGNTIRAIHIVDLRTYLDDAASRLGYSTSPYTDPGLTSGFVIKRIHIEELRQRIRTIAG